jgi:hypothetical protein
MHPKLVLNKLKVMGNSTSISTHWAFNSKMFFKKILIYMWPMFTHVHLMCTRVWIMNEIKLN